MPDATYVGAGMPCGNCGNPLTPGQPHKCGRTPDFDRRLDESWEPSPAASPDERLREAVDRLLVAFAAEEDEHGFPFSFELRDAHRALVAAADRDKPDDGFIGFNVGATIDGPDDPMLRGAPPVSDDQKECDRDV